MDTDLEFMVVILFTIQVSNCDDPSRVRIDPERQLIFVHLLVTGRRHGGQWYDPVRDLSVVGVVGVVSLNPDDAVSDGNVLDDRFLEQRRVESRSVVVDVADVDEQLRRVGSTWIAAILSPNDQPVAANRFEIQRLHHGHITAQRVDDKVALRVATDKRIT